MDSPEKTEAVAAKQEGAVFSASDSAGQPKSTLKKRLIIAAGVIFLLIAVVATWYFWPSSTEPKVEAQTAFDNAQKMKNKGNYTAAAEYSIKQYENAKGDNDKYLLAMQTATSYESNKDYKNALEWYQISAELKDRDAGSASGIGRCYDKLGDKQKAAEYYQKTLDWIDRSDPASSRNDIQLYEQLLQKAKAQ